MLLAVTTWSYPAGCLRGTGLVAPWQRGWSWPHLTSGLLGALLFCLWFLAAVLCFQVLGSDGWRMRLDGTPESCVGTPGGRLLQEDGGFRSPACAGAACGGHLGKGQCSQKEGAPPHFVCYTPCPRDSLQFSSVFLFPSWNVFFRSSHIQKLQENPLPWI